MSKTHLMIHHSLTADSGTVSWQAIRRYHVHTMGWKDCGYGFGVEMINGEYEVLLGRPETDQAAACKEGDMNRKAIHVCFVGNYDLVPPSDLMLSVAVKRLLVPLLKRYQIPTGNIVRHHDYATYKTCPGTMFPMDKLRSMCLLGLA